jgi:hypothetical protein
MPRPVKHCRGCRKDITAMRSDAVFCSAGCRAKTKRFQKRINLSFRRQRRCAECGGPMVVGLDDMRSDRQYCISGRETKLTKSGRVIVFNRSCRQRAYRKRRQLVCSD